VDSHLVALIAAEDGKIRVLVPTYNKGDVIASGAGKDGDAAIHRRVVTMPHSSHDAAAALFVLGLPATSMQ
jgi:hypothetical protein